MDTSSKYCTITMFQICDDSVIHSISVVFDIGYKHSEYLSASCQFLCASIGISISQLDGLYVVVGPGSFTGIRIGISYMRSLAQSLGISLQGINILDILFYQYHSSHLSNMDGVKSIYILIESIQKDVFIGRFDLQQGNMLKKKYVLSVDDLISELKQKEKLVILYGSGVRLYQSLFKDELSDLISFVHSDYDKISVGRFGELLMKNCPMDDAISGYPWQRVLPFYGRDPIVVERGRKSPFSMRT